MLKKYFSEIVNFTEKGKNPEENPDLENLTLIENITKQFNETWEQSLKGIKNECLKMFGNCESKVKILKRVMTSILEVYSSFFTSVKGSYPSFTSNMIPLHKLNIDVKTLINNVE